jgi:hypothetical protein
MASVAEGLAGWRCSDDGGERAALLFGAWLGLGGMAFGLRSSGRRHA